MTFFYAIRLWRKKGTNECHLLYCAPRTYYWDCFETLDKLSPQCSYLIFSYFSSLFHRSKFCGSKQLSLFITFDKKKKNYRLKTHLLWPNFRWKMHSFDLLHTAPMECFVRIKNERTLHYYQFWMQNQVFYFMDRFRSIRWYVDRIGIYLHSIRCHLITQLMLPTCDDLIVLCFDCSKHNPNKIPIAFIQSIVMYSTKQA